MALTKSMLDSMPCCKCGSAACADPMEFRSVCHAEAANVLASYRRKSGVLTLSCGVCGTKICEIAVKMDFTFN